MSGNITLQHDSVNGGEDVVLPHVEVSYTWKNLTNVDPTPSNYDIVESSFAGWENPEISLKGHIDVDDIMDNELTQELLVEFACLRSSTPIELTVPVGENDYIKGRPSSGYDTDGTMEMEDSIKIMITDFDIKTDNQSDRGRFMTYKINCHETKE